MSVLNGNAALLVDVMAGVSARCLNALVRDSSFECRPCVRRRECLFANSGREKGKGWGVVAAVFDEGKGVKQNPSLV